jgi:hypothetical protein
MTLQEEHEITRLAEEMVAINAKGMTKEIWASDMVPRLEAIAKLNDKKRSKHLQRLRIQKVFGFKGVVLDIDRDSDLIDRIENSPNETRNLIYDILDKVNKQA